MQKQARKAQEEMIGFVLIILVVAVIFLVFLFISVRTKPETELESIEISQFLDAMLSYTTDCAVDFEPAYSSVQELIAECSRGEICTSDKESCDVLSETAKTLIEESWAGKLGPNAPYKGYHFLPQQETSSGTKPISGVSPVFSMPVGECDPAKAVEVEKPLPGSRSVYFMLCEN